MLETLQEHLRTNQLEAALEAARAALRPASNSSQQLLLLERRFHELRNKEIVGTIDAAGIAVARAQLSQDLLQLAGAVPTADLTSTQQPRNVEAHYQDLMAQMRHFQTTVEVMTEKIIIAGKTLQTLGEVLQNPGDSPVPLSEMLVRGLRKTVRRIDLASEDFRHMRRVVTEGLQQLLEQHRELITYLDYPDEPVSADEKIRLRELRGHVATQVGAQERNKEYPNTFLPAIEYLESGGFRQTIDAALGAGGAEAKLAQELDPLISTVTKGFRAFSDQQEAFKTESSDFAPHYRSLLLDYDLCLAELG
jgi:hypothetical protein